MKNLSRGVFLLLMTAAGSQAAQFHIPLHLPPHRCVPAGDSAKDYAFGAGVSRSVTKGVNVTGPGGYFEVTALGKNDLGFSARSYGFVYKGNIDPLSLGSRTGTGMTGGFEIDLLWAPRGKEGYRLYTGFLTNITSLDIRDPLSFTLSGGTVKVEPDTAFSISLGFPLGVLVPFGIAGNWSGELQSDVTLFPSGVTFFSYLGMPVSPMYGSSRKIDPHFGGGVRLGALYEPWHVVLEVLGRISSGSGNNDPVTFTAAQAGLKF